jgi:hypothetical protein
MIAALINIKLFIMNKSILNLGKALSKAEQKSVNGSGRGGYICNAEGPIVVCRFASQCTLGSNGWYCA